MQAVARLQRAILRYQVDHHTPSLPPLSRLEESGYLRHVGTEEEGAYAIVCRVRADQQHHG